MRNKCSELQKNTCRNWGDNRAGLKQSKKKKNENRKRAVLVSAAAAIGGNNGVFAWRITINAVTARTPAHLVSFCILLGREEEEKKERLGTESWIVMLLASEKIYEMLEFERPISIQRLVFWFTSSHQKCTSIVIIIIIIV